MKKNILGIDLGTTSIGWAFVKESLDETQSSEIEAIGVRVNPLTTDEQTNFEKGKPVSVNADRTLKRSARRNLQRYKLRRNNLYEVLRKDNIISLDFVLSETETDSTHQTYAARSKAISEEITLEEFARIMFMINKKRGYKSSRKAKNPEEGELIDGMEVAKRLYDHNLTPGQLCYELLKENKKKLPQFYRSDLQNEFDAIWNFQKAYHERIITDEFNKKIQNKGQKATSAIFWATYNFNVAEIKGNAKEKKLKAYELRSIAPTQELSKEEVAYVLSDINGNIYNSSGYLGAISDRSKELYFKNLTVGEYLYNQLKDNPHTRLKNQVFYRQDYLDEFEKLWEKQSSYHKELTQELKNEIRDIVIFYQRKLKSQKNLVSFCEFEQKEKQINVDGKTKTIITGSRVCPKSSPLFQEFKIWQNLGNLSIINKVTGVESLLAQETEEQLFNELNVKGNLSKNQVLKFLELDEKEWELNYDTLEGNHTNHQLYKAFFQMMDVVEDDFGYTKMNASDILENVHAFLNSCGIDVSIIQFRAELDGKAFEKQYAYQLWHLLYSATDDVKKYTEEEIHTYGIQDTGLIKSLVQKFGFTAGQAKVLANIPLLADYGNLSAKAIRKIFPFIKESKYNVACKAAGYNHSSSITKEENENRELKDLLTLLPKNSLRNPVVEKILNQMVNVINTLIYEYSEKDAAGEIIKIHRFDEIRIELARDLKKNAKERELMTSSITKATAEHNRIREILKTEDGIKNPTKNDIIRYKLYQELKHNGYKTLYSDVYIERKDLFGKKYDIDHIIPQALLFDDSFSNKTLCPRNENLEKGNRCAFDFIGAYSGEQKLAEYIARIEMLYKQGSKSEGEGLSKAKYKKLLMQVKDIGEGFIQRDLRDSQYIAKKAKEMLFTITKQVVSTSGSITSKLREDWDLINVMQELNFPKYKKLGLTELIEKKDGNSKERIIDWTKRNDHRHHAMDALTIAFTQHNHIQYLNNLNARRDERNKKHGSICAIENKITELITDADGNKKRRFKKPLPNFREQALAHLSSVLVSHKAKNKVTTRNKNKFSTGNGQKEKIQLTPRGQLHNETIYGQQRQYLVKYEKIGAKTNEEIILRIAGKKEREALLKRLKEFNNDPKLAFTGKNSLTKNPIYIDNGKTEILSEKVKLTEWENVYSIRKVITPDIFKDFKNLEKVIDIGIRRILIKRLKDYGNAKAAFSNLDKNPIWQNEAKGIQIKHVTITGVTNAEPLHYKKDHYGKLVLDKQQKKIPVDYVSTSNNHHVAIYKDADGKLQENVVSFYEAVERANQGLPIINKNYNTEIGWQFMFTMKRNEFFIFPNEQTGFDPQGIDLLLSENYKFISPNLYRVQKLATRNYFFRHHLETNVEENQALKNITYKSQLGLSAIKDIIKVRINHIGNIVKVGEY